MAGAVLGLCLGGPVGLLAGAKLGSLAALGGSILGYTGASIIRERREVRRQLESPPPPAPAPKAKRRKAVQVKEEPGEEEEEEVGELVFPPHLHSSQWRRLQQKTEQCQLNSQQSILALIRPGGETEPANTLLVTAVVSSGGEM